MYAACCYVAAQSVRSGARRRLVSIPCGTMHLKHLQLVMSSVSHTECGDLQPLPQLARQQRSNAFLAFGFVPVEFLPARKS